jgi:hypothetical protein
VALRRQFVMLLVLLEQLNDKQVSVCLASSADV